MNIHPRSLVAALNFGYRRRLPMLLQSETAECGLACLGMMSAYFGQCFDMFELRRDFTVSSKGAALKDLMRIATQLRMESRAVKLPLDDLKHLRMPCLLHWNMAHFVVLKRVDANAIVIHDPACGIKRLPLGDAADAFSGVALELWPSPGFSPRAAPARVSLRALIGHIGGLLRSVAQIVILALALELFAIVGPFYMQWIVDDVIVSADRSLLTTLTLAFALLLVMQQLFAAARAWALMYLGSTLNIQWQANVFAHLLSLPAQYFEKRHLGDVVSRFGAVNAIQQTLTATFFSAVLDGLMTVASLGMMFLFCAPLACFSLGAMTLYGVGRRLSYRSLRHATETQVMHAARQQSHFLESMRGIRTVKLFERQALRQGGWLNLLVQQINAGLKVQKLHLLYGQANGLVFGAANLLTVWWGATRVLDGAFSVGVLFTFIAYKGQFEGRVSKLIDQFFELKMLQVHGERLADIVLTPPEPSGAGSTGTDCTDVLPSGYELRVAGVRYRYASQEPSTLDGIDLAIAEGESVAIVGASGCGKTTLINLMLGVLPPTEGRILIGGQALDQFGLRRYRGIVGTVMQDDALFAGSIGENISFFDPHADERWIAECAGLAQLHDDIVAMPMGYRTLVGDMGTVLSGGQKQRLLLARALYKRPRLLFLDEATSHLDVARERAVNQAIRSLDLTRIVVAHRAETIACAERIVLLDRGRLVMDAPRDDVLAYQQRLLDARR